jgi:lipopolysaccharide export system permease protein
VDNYLADLYFKISYPMINLIVVLLGVSLTTKVGRRGLARVFGVGLVICFTYYLFTKMGIALGHSGDLNPLLAAWIGNIVFFVLGMVLFIKVAR